jgi:hypothetical protein
MGVQSSICTRQEPPMTRVARSVFIYSIYVLGLGATLLLAPNVPLPIFGIPQTNEVWIRVAGMTVIFLGIFYLVAALNEYRQIFVVSVGIRFAVVVFFAAFAIAGFGPWNLVLLTPLDVLFAIWTLIELRREPATASLAAAA